MTYKLLYHPAVKKDLRSIPKHEQARIKTALETKIAIDPAYFGQALKGSLKPCFKFRVGKYRIIYDVVGTSIHVLIIAHRKTVYESADKRK